MLLNYQAITTTALIIMQILWTLQCPNPQLTIPITATRTSASLQSLNACVKPHTVEFELDILRKQTPKAFFKKLVVVTLGPFVVVSILEVVVACYGHNLVPLVVRDSDSESKMPARLPEITPEHVRWTPVRDTCVAVRTRGLNNTGGNMLARQAGQSYPV
ncbi:hypothetical protein E2542_SST16440 [Spatholobus suberectus]|nr:hypothetical protein E2542_SST16440 [Spatholobus suberectus]